MTKFALFTLTIPQFIQWSTAIIMLSGCPLLFVPSHICQYIGIFMILWACIGMPLLLLIYIMSIQTLTIIQACIDKA